MRQSIIHVTLLVKDYDDAIEFYVNKLNFKVVENTKLSDVKQSVLIQPPGFGRCYDIAISHFSVG
ncbi:glyoxalase/bleomycin resistance protein/dioxygenase superfamily protein [Mucilaginibacter gracilis]|uniref:Glyoxalase/bleomycin resistance protein/dioxygenase superfamily protein n=1 Tax=Mucilaginibacter gracilis TaxID=423350 RepID=A0A495J4D3_9SPHI|nr:VOC family protein [Mucilaginibacter gracilis]RKR83551.1 glyoxalase/bleomycin resistance protein/dioxygenase superfamily protein [Mucilaginibacter gracilis]